MKRNRWKEGVEGQKRVRYILINKSWCSECVCFCLAF